jgi:AcrR family transcriptional regulator
MTPVTQVHSPQRRELGDRQIETVERLLAAGAEELAEVGHDALTIRSVAARAGVSPATAYTYLASKNHLFAELFLRRLLDEPEADASGADPVARVQALTRAMAAMLASAPALAAAVTPALLGSDPDVARLRVRIGTEFLRRFGVALGRPADDDLVDALNLAFSGAMLQAGMGVLTYDELGNRLDTAAATILKGHA